MAAMDVDIDDSRSAPLSCLGKGRKRIFEERFQHEIDKQLGVAYNFKARKKVKRAIAGITTLHFAMETNEQQQIETLSNNRYNFTIKNSKGHTVILQHIKEDKLHFYKVGCEFFAFYKYEETVSHCTNLVLLAHVKYNNLANICNSDFQVACILANAQAVETLWIDKILLNQNVNVDLKIFSGYPTLHFAAEHSVVDTAKALLDKGAQVDLKDVKGQTPLEMLVTRNMEIIDWIRMGKEGSFKKLVGKFNKNKRIIEMILKAISKSNEVVLATLENRLNQDICDTNMWIAIRKSLWRGFTLLPVDLHINIGIASTQESNLIKDEKRMNKSLLSLRSFMAEYPFNESQSNWKNIRFSDDTTSLAEFYAATKDVNRFEEFMKKISYNVIMFIPHDSPVLPGCTPLHLAILFSAKMDYDNVINCIFDFKNDFSSKSYNYISSMRNAYIDVIKFCLELGADITVTNSHGNTPLRLAEKLFGKPVAMLLERFCTRTAQTIGEGTKTVEKFQLNPYHLTMLLPTLHEKIVQLRNELSINIYNTTEQQMTMDKLHKDNPDLFYQAVDEFVTEKNPANVTALHAACCKLDSYNVEIRLVSEDPNVRTQVDSNFWAGFTPLHFLTMKRGTCDVDKLISIARALLYNGADVTLKNSYGFTPLHQALDNIFLQQSTLGDKERMEFLVVLLQGHYEFNVNPTDPRGITHFHIACICDQAELVKQFVKSGVDVNLKINEQSNIYKGFTPLHLAARYKNKETLDQLLKLGADINARNHAGNTPLHEAADYFGHYKGFGYDKSNVEVIKSLVKVGSDIEVQNSIGQIPLELLLETTLVTDEIFKILLKNLPRLNLFNPINEVGLIGAAMMFSYNLNLLRKHPAFKAVLNHPGKNIEDSNGRTPVHNIVAMRHYSTQWIKVNPVSVEVLTEAIKSFEKLGFDVDHQDYKGRTALHIAAKFWNCSGVDSLLCLGSDINIVDVEGETPISRLQKIKLDPDIKSGDKQYYEYKQNCTNAFFKHIYKMKLAHMHVNEINEKVYAQLQKQMSADDDFSEKCKDELKKVMDRTNGSSPVYLGGFFVKLERLMIVYKKMKPKKRRKLDEVFDNVEKNYPEFSGLLQMQYRRLRSTANYHYE